MTYTVADGKGGTSEPATFTVTVSPNSAPVAVDDFGAITENTVLTVANDDEGHTGTITKIVTDDKGDTSSVTSSGTVNADLLLNDEDADGDPLTITGVNGDTASVGTAVDGSKGGSFTIRDDGSYTFNPDGDFDDLKPGKTGTTSVTYTAFDGTAPHTATLTVTVTGANTGSVTEDAAVDANGKLKTSGKAVFINGDAGFKAETISDTGTYYGSLTIETDGTWTYTADNSDSKINALGKDDSPTDTFTVTNADKVSTTTVTITINGANDAPVAVDDFGATTENKMLTVANDDEGTIETDDADSSTMTINADLLLNDTDAEGDRLTITKVGSDKSSQVEASVGKATAGTDEDGNAGGTFTIEANGAWSFDPGKDFDNLAKGATRTTSVVYTVSDVNGATATATVTVTVTGENDAPMAVADIGGTAENTAITVADRTISGTITTTITAVNGDTASVGKATAGHRRRWQCWRYLHHCRQWRLELRPRHRL